MRRREDEILQKFIKQTARPQFFMGVIVDCDIYARRAVVQVDGSGETYEARISKEINIKDLRAGDGVRVDLIKSTYFVTSKLINNVASDSGYPERIKYATINAASVIVPRQTEIGGVSFSDSQYQITMADDEDGTNEQIIAQGYGFVQIPNDLTISNFIGYRTRQTTDEDWSNTTYIPNPAPYQGQLAQLPATNKYVIDGTFVLQGQNPDTSWSTIPSKEYTYKRKKGKISQNPDLSDWGNYIAFRASYSLFNAANGSTTSYSNQSITMTRSFTPSAIDQSGTVDTDAQVNITIQGGHVGGFTVANGLIAADSGNMFFDSINQVIGLGSPTITYASGAGIWQGKDSGTYKWRVGDPAAQYVKWDGSNLILTGSIYATGGSIDGSIIVDKTIIANKLDVDTLNSITANLGAVFIGSDLEISEGGALHSGQNAFNAGTGFYFAYNEGTPVFSIGNGVDKYLVWDGSNVITSGNVYLTGGAFLGVVSIDVAGGVYQGTGSFASPITGLKIWSDGGFGRISSYNSSVLQAGFTSDGKFGAGFVNDVPYVIFDQSGLIIKGTFPTPSSSVTQNSSTTANDGAVGSIAWSNPNNVQTHEDVSPTYASASLVGGGSANTGATSPTISDNDSSVGVVAWSGHGAGSSAGNIGSSNDSRATVALTGTSTATEGPNVNTNAADDASYGEASWVIPTNGANENGTTTSVYLQFDDGNNRGQYSHYLKASSFNNSIPAGCTVTGIKVGIKKWCASGALVKDQIVRLGPGGTIGGNNYAAVNAAWPSSLTWVEYGGSTDLWGYSASTFGSGTINGTSMSVFLSVRSDNIGVYGYVDAFRMTIYYTIQNNQSNYLIAKTFGFSVPAGSAINGIVAEVELSATASNTVYDYYVRLIKSGAITGANKARAASSYWGTTDAYITYGASNNLWSTTWTTSNINASGFGLAVAAQSNGSATARIDHIRITVYYTTSGGSQSNYLKATNFGFTAPGTATINGVKVEINKKADNAANVTDTVVKLVKGGTVGGNDKSSATPWNTSFGYSSYGGSADLWGNTLTYSDVNSSTFGFVISCSAANVPETAYIEHVRITIYYSDSATVSPINFNGFGFMNDGLYEYTEGVIFSQTASRTISNDATEKTLTNSGRGSLTLPANFLTAGKSIRITAFGVYGTTGSPNFRIRVFLNSTAVASTTNIAAPSGVTNRGWKLDVIITCRSVGGSGTTFTQGTLVLATGGSDSVSWDLENTATDTIDTTVTQAIDVMSTFGTASGSNTVTCTNLVIEALG